MSAVFQGLRINSDPVETMIIAIIICIYIFFVVFVKILFIIDSNPSDLLYLHSLFSTNPLLQNTQEC